MAVGTMAGVRAFLSAARSITATVVTVAAMFGDCCQRLGDRVGGWLIAAIENRYRFRKPRPARSGLCFSDRPRHTMSVKIRQKSAESAEGAETNTAHATW